MSAGSEQALDGLPQLDAGMRSSIEGALEIVRARDPGMHGLIHNLERLGAWLDGHPQRDDNIRSYYPAFEKPLRIMDEDRLAVFVEHVANMLPNKMEMVGHSWSRRWDAYRFIIPAVCHALGIVREETVIERFARESGVTITDDNRSAVEAALAYQVRA